MNGIISSEIFDKDKLEAELNKCPDMEGLELASRVSTKEPYFAGDPDSDFKVSALDIGIKRSILKCLTDRGCYVKVFPHNVSYEEFTGWGPDGYFLSNGPGDPAAMPGEVELVKRLLSDDKVIFGICLGHQMLCRAVGLGTFKMHNGHRGINHPVLNKETNIGEITSQNHGFAVSLEDAESNQEVVVTHMNLNDNTLEGVRIKGKRAFSVQYHPEASPGPHDSRYLFDSFVELMKEARTVTV